MTRAEEREIREAGKYLEERDLSEVLSFVRSNYRPTAQGTPTPGDGVYTFSVDERFDPSGLMGDVGDLRVEKGSGSVSFVYEVKGQGPREWQYKYVGGSPNPISPQFAGVMYLSSPDNWGNEPGFDIRGFRHAIAWEARSLEGDVQVEFVIGGVTWQWNDQTKQKVAAPHPDSMRRRSLGRYRLTGDQQWKSFEVKLTEKGEDEFASVIGGFAWVISWTSNGILPNETRTAPLRGKTFKIEIRNIRYKR